LLEIEIIEQRGLDWKNVACKGSYMSTGRDRVSTGVDAFEAEQIIDWRLPIANLGILFLPDSRLDSMESFGSVSRNQI
jgi:hypothetical protein